MSKTDPNDGVITEVNELIERLVKYEVDLRELEMNKKLTSIDKKVSLILKLFEGVPNCMMHNYIHYLIEVAVIITLSVLLANSCTPL